MLILENWKFNCSNCVTKIITDLMIDYMYCNSEFYTIDLINSDLVNINCYIAIWKYTKKKVCCTVKKVCFRCIYIYVVSNSTE